MKQRAITELEVEHILQYPEIVIKSFDGTHEAVGEINSRTIRVKFAVKESYLKIITVM